MKSKILALLLLTISATYTAQAAFVGTTSDFLTPGQQYNGFVGIAAANAACDSDFKRSHMCTTREIYFSNMLKPPGIKAWVYPHFVGGLNEFQLGDFVGFHDQPNELTCEVWINSEGKPTAGLVMLETGLLTREANCNQALPIACCR